MVLSDNGSCFKARAGAVATAFQRNLAMLGIRTINSRPGHPETCGKIERSHQTTKGFLGLVPRAESLAALQHQLDQHRAFYNSRPHSGISGLTPLERFRATLPATSGDELDAHDRIIFSSGIVTNGGAIRIGVHRAHVGAEWAGRTLSVVRKNLTVIILNHNEIIRVLEIDPTKDYQGSGRPRGGIRKRPR